MDKDLIRYALVAMFVLSLIAAGFGVIGFGATLAAMASEDTTPKQWFDYAAAGAALLLGPQAAVLAAIKALGDHKKLWPKQ